PPPRSGEGEKAPRSQVLLGNAPPRSSASSQGSGEGRQVLLVRRSDEAELRGPASPGRAWERHSATRPFHFAEGAGGRGSTRRAPRESSPQGHAKTPPPRYRRTCPSRRDPG